MKIRQISVAFRLNYSVAQDMNIVYLNLMLYNNCVNGLLQNLY
jgi:hypothetical protein